MAAASNVSLSMAADDVAVITFEPPAGGNNVFSRPVLEQLNARLDELDKKSGLVGLIFRSSKPGAWVYGADIREFQQAKDITKDQVVEMCTSGRKVFQRLTSAPYISVAAVDGVCLGGGAELALWCDRRVIGDDRKSQLGFPEVKIGIFPGWGGTARAPRMIGLANAIELVCVGESIDGKAAAGFGLVSDVVPPDQIQDAAIAVIRGEQQSGDYLEDRKTWAGRLPIDDTELAFLATTASGFIQQQTKGQYPAPVAALNTMVESAGVDIDAACDNEARGMAGLFGTPVNRSLMNVFFMMEGNKKDIGVDDASVQPTAVGSVGVFGAGIMGAGIAAAGVRKNLPVTITDMVEPALKKGVAGILEEVSFDRAAKGPSGQKAVERAPLINATSADEEFSACDLVIEAIIEREDAKKELYARIEPHLKDGAILASNTSTIPITTLAADLKHPERFCGIHFFNPVRKMPLVEVIRGQQTSDATVATAVAYAKAIGKSPVVVNDGPGFLVNRLLLPYMNEALELLLDGADMKSIDRAAKSFGMPMGPIALYDVVGLDTALYAGAVMQNAFPDRVVESPLLPAMVEAKRLGQKTGVGFFKYQGGKAKGIPDPTLGDIIGPLVRGKQSFSEEQIIGRLFLPMVLEATRILEEKIVRRVQDVDLGLIFGTGFPPFKGGLLFWADTIGADKLVEQLKPLADLGPRCEPTPMLLEMAASGRGFYG